MGRLIACFLLIIGGFYAYVAKAETILHGVDSNGVPQPVRVNSAGQVTFALMACEDQTNGVCKVEHQYSYCIITADTQCKASAGFVHAISCATSAGAAATAGALTLRNATTETTPIAHTIGIPAAAFTPFGFVIDEVFSTGIYAGFDATLAGVSCTVSYR